MEIDRCPHVISKSAHSA